MVDWLESSLSHPCREVSGAISCLSRSNRSSDRAHLISSFSVHARSARWWPLPCACRHPSSPALARSASRARPMIRNPDRVADRHNRPSDEVRQTDHTARMNIHRPACQRSAASGTEIEPSSIFFGPSAPGMTSKSNISVGNHNVAQALGMSTTPEICP